MQSRTKDSNTLFEQTKRSLTGPSKDAQERKKIVDNLKLPKVFAEFGPDAWFDWQSYAELAHWLETRNPGVKFDKEIMDDAWEKAYSGISNATINVRKKQFEKMKDRVSMLQNLLF
jgi:hypothetical protein